MTGKLEQLVHRAREKGAARQAEESRAPACRRTRPRPGRSDSLGRALAAEDATTGKLRRPWTKARRGESQRRLGRR